EPPRWRSTGSSWRGGFCTLAFPSSCEPSASGRFFAVVVRAVRPGDAGAGRDRRLHTFLPEFHEKLICPGIPQTELACTALLIAEPTTAGAVAKRARAPL